MLRTLSPSFNSHEPKLVDLCRQKKWIAVSLRSLSHPSEASPNESAMMGEGSTLLAMAVRSGAPLSVLQALVKADLYQVGVVHDQRGNILHEAMKHRVSEDCLRFLLQSIIDYERVTVESTRDCQLHPRQQRQQQQQQQQYKCLLGRQDSMGRTALHFMIERAVQELLSPHQTHGFDNYNSHHNSANNMADDDTSFLSRGSWILFQSLVLAYPPAIHVMDCDGNTPLVLLLLVSGRMHHHHRRHHHYHRLRQQQHQQARAVDSANPTFADKMEAIIFRMIRLLVATSPSTAIISRRLPRPFRCCAQHSFTQNHFITCSKQLHPKELHQKQQLIGDGAPNPLSYALLYQRSIETIQLLLKANQKVGVRGCMTIVSHYHEVPLHIAVTMRVPIAILDQLIRHGPCAASVTDSHGLLPLDWCWIRHVIDWFTPMAERHFMASRRRHVPTSFRRWHEQVSQQQYSLMAVRDRNANNSSSAPCPITSTSATETRPSNQRSHISHSVVEDHDDSLLLPLTDFQLTCDVWHRMQVLLPVMACQQMEMLRPPQPEQDRDEYQPSITTSSFSVLHAACFVSCPLAVVRMALGRSPRRWLACRDAIMNRLPVHYAASRVVGYKVQVPVGFTNEHLESIVEPSPVADVISEWEQAARVTDGQGQLPLHIAIDAYKTARRQQQLQRQQQEQVMLTIPPEDNLVQPQTTEDDQELDEVVELILSHHPEALERRDGKTRLFPFQQAAAGEGANLNTIFTLLLRQPTLVDAQVR